jgi:hypothetical protein
LGRRLSGSFSSIARSVAFRWSFTACVTCKGDQAIAL